MGACKGTWNTYRKQHYAVLDTSKLATSAMEGAMACSPDYCFNHNHRLLQFMVNPIGMPT